MKTLVACITLALALPVFADSTCDLFNAIEKNNLKKVEKILKADGVDVNAYNGRCDGRVDHHTPLIRAVVQGYTDIAIALLNAAANPNLVRQIDQHSPLMIAASRNDARLASILLAHRATLNAISSTGRTALIIAASNNAPDSAHVLASTPGINLNATPAFNPKASAIGIAARQGYLGVIDAILSHTSETDRISDRNLEAAIELARYNGHTDAEMRLREYN